MEYTKQTTHTLELTDKDLVALGDLVRVILNARGTLALMGEQMVVDLVQQIKEQVFL